MVTATIKLPVPKNPPEVLVFGEKRQECLMTPIAGSSAKNAVFVDGGVDLMDRLLYSDAKNWTVKKEYLTAKHAAPNPHTIFDLENVKSVKGEPATSGQYRNCQLRKTEDDPDKTAAKATTGAKVDAPAGTSAGAAGDKPPPTASTTSVDQKIIVWNDFGVRRSNAITAKSDARLLIYQMRSPIFRNELWDKAKIATQRPVDIKQKDAATGHIIDSKGFQKVLIVIDAEDLRTHGFNISRRVSWEKTMEDFYAHFEEITNHIHDYMHLIVRLGYEGAIYVPPKRSQVTTEETKADSSTNTSTANSKIHDPIGAASPTEPTRQESKPQNQFYCYLVPDKAEGDLLRAHKGNIPGIDMAFVADLVASLVRESDYSLSTLDDTKVRAAVDSALNWSHRFASVRFYEDGGYSLNYPCPIHFDLQKYPRPRLISVQAKGTIKERGDWSLFNLLAGVKTEVSSDIVTKGSTAWLESSVPTARFGNLLTADRKEIECFRSTAAVIDEYLASPPGKPLSIAVFGSPGSGKSFGVKEVIQTMLPDVKDSMRDKALAGKTPVVLFDEFDSVFEQSELGWLKYFLAPMQDGYFLEDGQQRTLKNAIFIFIGGTSATWAEFTEGMDAKDEEQKDIPLVDGRAAGDTPNLDRIEKAKKKRDKDKMVKKPDFVSRLSAYIDIRGLNKIGKGDEDEMFTIRRAMILRSALSRRLNVSDGKDIPVDGRVLNALLAQREFRHGARSIALILQMSALSGRKQFEASALPSDEQLSMHIDVVEFKRNIRKDIHGNKPHTKNAKKHAMTLDIELRKVLLKMER
ncbi:hypothetical protein NW768_011829 [Fusarium equiseti]|uniref:ATPase AAA-type core domain-containing protein n=1 Tax=Fusarium equiseti TaxID=61235 RepID=A0ABQ8QWK1_FUSEQ|nr:hypothetical protein NW768_011829 [Fusarium equiseti]